MPQLPCRWLVVCTVAHINLRMPEGQVQLIVLVTVSVEVERLRSAQAAHPPRPVHCSSSQTLAMPQLPCRSLVVFSSCKTARGTHKPAYARRKSAADHAC